MSAVGDTTETTQMYLRTVLELELAGVPALRARLVERLHHSAPAVSQTVAKLARPAYRTKMKKELEQHLDKAYEGDVMGVYFTDFVTQ